MLRTAAAPSRRGVTARGLRLAASPGSGKSPEHGLQVPPSSSLKLLLLKSDRYQSTVQDSSAASANRQLRVSFPASQSLQHSDRGVESHKVPRYIQLDTDHNNNGNGDNYGLDNGGNGGEKCVYYTLSSSSSSHLSSSFPVAGQGWGRTGARRQHVVETMLTVVVKDINDNAPLFSKTTVHGLVQENGPASKYRLIFFYCLLTLL